MWLHVPFQANDIGLELHWFGSLSSIAYSLAVDNIDFAIEWRFLVFSEGPAFHLIDDVVV